MDFKPIDFDLKGITKDVLQQKWLCHYNAEKFVDGIKNNKKVIVTTGIGLSGTPHMGTLSQILRAIYLQQAGIDVQFVLGDLDSYNARNQSLDILAERVEKYTNFIENLGFDNSKGYLRSQIDYTDVLKTAYLISNCLTDQDFLDAEEDLSELYKSKKIYNGIDFKVKQAILLMVADFIHLGTVSNYDDVLVMLGLEEHLYVQIAQKVVDRMNLDMSLGALYSRIIKGLNGYPKMSKSIPDSAITVDMSQDEIVRLVTGSKDEYSIPDDSTIYQMMSAVSYYNSDELLELRELCLAKGKAWEEKKKEYSLSLSKICKEWK
ncbi:MAG: hypothetical protein PHX04_03950 [Bacilli bacterium]|nr:hypothetical protein [Bacilli bacterium]